MTAPQRFRTVFHGFRREDVVQYLEYLNARHAEQVGQLEDELNRLRLGQEEAAPLREQCAQLTAQLERLRQEKTALEERCAALEEQLAQAAQPREPAPAPTEEPPIDRQLQSYRRADQVEREAQDRADLVYFQARAVLRQTGEKVDAAAREITDMADAAMRQLTQLQVAVSGSKRALQDAAATLDAIRPNP